jgi:hypothetical protein
MTHVCCKLEQSNYDFPIEFKILGLDDKNNGFSILFSWTIKILKILLEAIYIYIESRDSLGFFFFNARIDYLIVHLK